jgi:hypothetical protein
VPDGFSSVYPGDGPFGDPENGNVEALKKVRRMGWNIEEPRVVFL